MTPIILNVSQQDIDFAQNQIREFEQTPAGQYRYDDVEAWRGIVCEMLVSRWLGTHFTVNEAAKGLDTTGIVDDYDLKVNGHTVEVKSATKNYFQYLMPKIHDVDNHPKEFYIGAKYNETVTPNQVIILGYITPDEIRQFPTEQNKGARYYKVPLSKLRQITQTSFN